MSEPIITVTEYEHLGKWATARKLLPGELTVRFGDAPGRTAEYVRINVVIPDLKQLSNWRDADGSVTVNMKLPVPLAGTRNRAERDVIALCLMIGAPYVGGETSVSGKPITSQAVLDALDAEIAKFCDAFNGYAKDAARRIVSNAISAYPKEFLAERNQIEGLSVAKRMLAKEIADRKDALHEKSRAMVIEFFKGQGIPLNFDELSQTGRDRSAALFDAD